MKRNIHCAEKKLFELAPNRESDVSPSTETHAKKKQWHQNIGVDHGVQNHAHIRAELHLEARRIGVRHHLPITDNFTHGIGHIQWVVLTELL